VETEHRKAVTQTRAETQETVLLTRQGIKCVERQTQAGRVRRAKVAGENIPSDLVLGETLPTTIHFEGRNRVGGGRGGGEAPRGRAKGQGKNVL